MSKSKSPMMTKVFMANVRENKKLARLDPVPELMAERPKVSRGRVPEFRMSRGEQIRLELSRRSYMSAEAREMRRQMVGSVREAVYATK